MEHRATRDVLSHEVDGHTETEKTLGCCWKTLMRLGNVCGCVGKLLDGQRVDAETRFKYADLLLEIEFRKQRTIDLESELAQKDEKSNLIITAQREEIQKEAAQHKELLQAKDHQIMELERSLADPPRKRRTRGGGRATDDHSPPFAR